MKKLVFTAFMLLCLVFISQAQIGKKVGQKFGGGIVFDVIPNGLHGLIAETQDQSSGCQWDYANAAISNPGKHSIDGKQFTDWRLPTKDELIKLYKNKNFVGGFEKEIYWSSTAQYAPPPIGSNSQKWVVHFNNGSPFYTVKTNSNRVRSIRSF
jgi:hypothetical protein